MRRAVLAVTLAALCSPALAQRTRAQTPPKPAAVPAEAQRTTATFADWTLRCIRPEGAPAACEVTQTVYDKSQPVAQTAIGRATKAEPLRLTVLVPANVLLTTAPKFQPGEGEPALDLVWRLCLPTGCRADAALTDDQLRRLRARADNGRITFQDGGGHDASIPFAPRGLGPALDALAKETG